ncbi:NAD-dependent epimerase/dehydratase family protein [Microbacterium laevaniformans]|uniref:NAD-dependent epimerase/dehydratase family protein n=1 Tax=Microbacterium laevaniformans TaxID=36807 RepID=UPI0022F28335|nr:NAD(P)-dependent oxidoreductase [Microbacterium laevaniformans]
MVVGAGGFIGSAVVRRLVTDGHAVAYAKRPASSTARLAGLDLHSITIDETFDRDTVTRSLREFGTDIVINVAWSGVANHARNDPSQFDNVTLADGWAHAAAEAGVGHYIGVGSQAEYGPTDGIIDENTPLLPTTRYGVAKAAAGLATRAALLESATAFTWVRIFSAYGPGDAPHWMIQAVGRLLLRNEAAEMTPGTQLWDYIYVDDIAAAFAAMATVSGGVGYVNLGSGTVSTIRQIVEQMREISGSRSDLRFGAVPFRPDQVMHLQADISRLTSATNWRPQVPLYEGLARTIEHLRKET